MGEVRGEHQRAAAGQLHEAGQAQLVALAADEDAAGLDVAQQVVAGPAVADGGEPAVGVVLAEGGPGVVEALQAGDEPVDPALQEGHPQAGMAVEDAVADDAGQSDHLAPGVAQGVDDGPHVEVVDPPADVAAAVHRQAAAQPLGLGVHRPVLAGPEVALEAVGGQHRPLEAPLADGAAQLLHRGLGDLQRQQGHAAQAGIGGHEGVVEPVVVGPAQGHSHLGVVDPARGQARGGIQHGPLDPDLVEELPPLGGPHLALAVEAGRRVAEAGVDVVQRGEQADHRGDQAHAAGRLQGHLPVGLGQVLEDLGGVLLHMAVGVDDPDSRAGPARGCHARSVCARAVGHAQLPPEWRASHSR